MGDSGKENGDYYILIGYGFPPHLAGLTASWVVKRGQKSSDLTGCSHNHGNAHEHVFGACACKLLQSV